MGCFQHKKVLTSSFTVIKDDNEVIVKWHPDTLSTSDVLTVTWLFNNKSNIQFANLENWNIVSIDEQTNNSVILRVIPEQKGVYEIPVPFGKSMKKINVRKSNIIGSTNEYSPIRTVRKDKSWFVLIIVFLLTLVLWLSYKVYCSIKKKTLINKDERLSIAFDNGLDKYRYLRQCYHGLSKEIKNIPDIRDFERRSSIYIFKGTSFEDKQLQKDWSLIIRYKERET